MKIHHIFVSFACVSLLATAFLTSCAGPVSSSDSDSSIGRAVSDVVTATFPVEMPAGILRWAVDDYTNTFLEVPASDLPGATIA